MFETSITQIVDRCITRTFFRNLRNKREILDVAETAKDFTDALVLVHDVNVGLEEGLAQDKSLDLG